MHKNSRKPASYANKILNKTSKIISVFVVILLLSTVATSAIGSSRFVDRLSKIKSNLDDAVDKATDKINTIKENIKDSGVTVKQTSSSNLVRTSSSSPLLSFIQSIKSYFPLRESGSLLSLYTKYGDNDPQQTSLSLLKSKRVDVDGDGVNDIKAKYSIYPFVEKPLAISFNIKLEVDRLLGFEDIKEYFEVYVDFSFPGLLNGDMADNSVQFGYQSEKGEEVPSKCYVTYQYVPYFFSKEKPLHKTKLDPGSAADTEGLAMIFNYIDSNSSSVDKFAITLRPAVNAEITYGGLSSGGVGRSLIFDSSKASTAVITYEKQQDGKSFNAGLIIYKISDFTFDMEITPFSKGGGRIEYERASNSPVDVTLFFEKNSSAYIYVDDIPKHVRLSWTPEMDGIVELNTFDEHVAEIGIRNAIREEEVTAKAYIRNLPSLIQTKWNWTLFKGGSVDIYADTAGCSAYIFAKDLMGSGATLRASFTTVENINMSVFWNLSDGSFGIRRTNSDISVSASIINLGGVNVNLSFSIENTITSPFEFNLGEILDGVVDITFTGNDFELTNLNLDVFVPGIGTAYLKMYKFIMSRFSTIHFVLSKSQVDQDVTLTCEIDVTNGVEIRGLVIGLDDFLYPIDDIDTDGSYHHLYTLTFTEGFVQFGGNTSEGYVRISGALIVTFDSVWKDGSIPIGSVSGVVAFNNENEVLNISWGPDGLNVDGNGVVSLTNFELWIKNKMDVSIPSIVGSFVIDTYQGAGELRLNVGKSTATFCTDIDIDLVGLMDATIQADVNLDFELGLSGYVYISWDEAGFAINTAGASVGFDGVLSVYNIYFNYADSIVVSAMSFKVSGDFLFSVDIYPTISFNSDHGASFTINDLDFEMDGFHFSCARLHLGASGYLFVNLPGDYIELDVNGAVSLINADVSSLGLGVGRVSFETTASLKGFYIRGLIGALSGNINLRIDKKGNSPIKLDNFYLNVDDPSVLLKWDRLHISGKGVIELSDKIVIDATLTGVEFIGFMFTADDVMNMAIDGNVNLNYAGALTIDANVGNSISVELMLNSGSLSVTDLSIGVSSGDIFVDAFWDSLILEGSATFDLTGSKSKGFNIGASGNGGISLNDLSVSGALPSEDEDGTYAGDFSIDLGYFNLELDDINASLIGLQIGETFNIYSASVIGSICSIDLQDLSVNASELIIEGLFYLRATEIGMNFEGSGEVSFEITEPDENDVQNINLNGEIVGDGSISIDNLQMFVNPVFMYVEIQDLLISGPTTFYLNAEGILDYNADIENKLEYIQINAGCDAKWSIGRLFIGTLIEIIDFNSDGPGDISFSAEIPSSLGDPSGDLIISLSGSWNWSEFKLVPGVNWSNWEVDGGFPLGPGSFEGDISLAFGLGFLNIIFFQPLPVSSGVSIIANQETCIHLFAILGIGILGADLNLQQGYFEFTYSKSNETTVVQLGETQIPVPKNIAFEIVNTMDVSISAIELFPNFFDDADCKLYIAGAEFSPGTFSVESNIEDLGNVNLKIQSSSTIHPTIDIIKLSNAETSTEIISLFDISFEAAYLEIAYNIDAATGDADKEGYVFVDTNGEQLSLELYAFEIFYIGGCYFEADDWNVSWNFSSGWSNPFKKVHKSGYLDIYCTDGGIGFKFDGIWYSLVGNVDTDELIAQLLPQAPFEEGDNFKVHVTDPVTNDDISGATVEYQKKGLIWNTVATLTTGSDGYTPDFTAETYNDDVTDSRVRVTYSGYNSVTENFVVNPSTSSLDVDIIYSGDKLYEGHPFTIHVTDDSADVAGASVYYEAYDEWSGDLFYTSNTLQTGSDGCVDFTAIAIDDSDNYASCKAHVSYDGEDIWEYFQIWDENAAIWGIVYDSMYPDTPITGVKITCLETGDYTYTQSINPVGYYELQLPPGGPYTIQATKSGYDSDTKTVTSLDEGDRVHVPDFYLVSNSHGYIDGTVYDSEGEELYHAYIYLDGVYMMQTGYQGGHYTIQASPGAHTVRAECEHYIADEITVTVTSGQTTDNADFYLETDGEWVKPTGFDDPEEGWVRETEAYDDSLTTSAETSPLYYNLLIPKWTKPIIFETNPIDCTQIKYYALGDATYIDEMKLELYYDNDWHTIRDGPFVYQHPSTIQLDAIYTVTKARFSFHILGCATGTSAEIYDFQLYKLN